MCSDLCRVAVRRSPRGKAEAPGDQVKEEEEIQERAEDAGSLPLEVKKEDETVTGTVYINQMEKLSKVIVLFSRRAPKKF